VRHARAGWRASHDARGWVCRRGHELPEKGTALCGQNLPARETREDIHHCCRGCSVGAVTDEARGAPRFGRRGGRCNRSIDECGCPLTWRRWILDSVVPPRILGVIVVYAHHGDVQGAQRLSYAARAARVAQQCIAGRVVALRDGIAEQLLNGQCHAVRVRGCKRPTATPDSEVGRIYPNALLQRELAPVHSRQKLNGNGKLYHARHEHRSVGVPGNSLVGFEVEGSDCNETPSRCAGRLNLGEHALMPRVTRNYLAVDPSGGKNQDQKQCSTMQSHRSELRLPFEEGASLWP